MTTFLICLLLLLGLPNTSLSATSITQYGITWTFSSDCQTGQFVTGDYWIVDSGAGCVLTSVSNNFHIVDLSTIDYDGSQLNAVWTEAEIASGQGLDSRVILYKSEANINKKLPFTLTAGNSLLTAISWQPGDVGEKSVPLVKRIAVLTCLGTAPSSGDFRPSYASGVKTIYSSAGVTLSKVPSLSPTGTGLSNISRQITVTSGPWTDLFYGYQSQYLRASDNYPEGAYNRYVAATFGAAILSATVDLSNDTDRLTLVRQLVQIGIDYFGILKSGGKWPADGGHQHGYKLPILFAGLMLNDNEMLNIGKEYAGTDTFADDSTLFVIEESHMYPNRTVCGANNGSPPCPKFHSDRQYTIDNGVYVGLPEWGVIHSVHPYADDASADAAYRVINGGPLAMHALGALIFGLDEEWNNNLFFAYHDRFMSSDGLGKKADTTFGQTMWELYRHAYRQYWPTRRLFRNVRVSAEVEP